MIPRVLRLAVAVLVIAGCAMPAARAGDIDAALREAVHRIDVPGTGASIVVTSFRPPGGGPFPWIVLSHGTAVTLEDNRAIGRSRNTWLAAQWVRRGYAVLVPVRRGYGASGGSENLGDSYGSCARPDFPRAGEGAALDLLATVQWAKGHGDIDPRRFMLVGQSAGGFASIYTASKRPEGLLAVLAFAPGRGGRPDTHPGQPCMPERMAELFSSIAPRIAVPVLWFYAVNDEFVGPAAQRLWFESFRAAGGRGELVVIPPFPERRGHGVFTSPAGEPLWTAAVAGFFRSQRIGLPF